MHSKTNVIITVDEKANIFDIYFAEGENVNLFYRYTLRFLEKWTITRAKRDKKQLPNVPDDRPASQISLKARPVGVS